MKNKKLLPVLLVISILLSFTACGKTQLPATVSEPEAIEPFDTAIVKIIDDRQSAIQNKDYDLYMSAIGKNNQFFCNEQDTWFYNMIEDTMSNWSFEVVSTEMIDEKTAVATIHQKHTSSGEDFDFEYPLLFKYEDGKWMDYGYNFKTVETDRFIIRYMDGETRLEEFQKYLEDAFDHVEGLYGEKPAAGYEMKLFYDQEMLRQQSTPASPWLFTACSDADESLKIFTGRPADYLAYPGTVQHELVHNITIRMCANNLSMWLVEGIAMYDGSAYYDFSTSPMLMAMTKDGVSKTIDYLEENDMYTDSLSMEETFFYYDAGYMYVKYILETYGREALMDIFREAGKEPYHNTGVIDEEFNAINREITANAISKVLGVTTSQLSEGYLQWLDTVDFEALVK